MAKFVDKAKGGDVGAARFVIDHLLGAKQTPSTVIVNQFYDGDGPPRQMVGTASPTETPLRQVTTYLSAHGSATPELIAADIQLPVGDVVQVLQQYPERFDVAGNRFSLHS